MKWEVGQTVVIWFGQYSLGGEPHIQREDEVFSVGDIEVRLKETGRCFNRRSGREIDTNGRGAFISLLDDREREMIAHMRRARDIRILRHRLDQREYRDSLTDEQVEQVAALLGMVVKADK